jgi:hypothetical protein
VTFQLCADRDISTLLQHLASDQCPFLGQEQKTSARLQCFSVWPISEVGHSPAAVRYALMRGTGTETHGGLMYIFIRKFTKVRSVADAARRAKSGIGRILRESHGFRSYYVLDGGEGVAVAVMVFADRESAKAANDKVLEFVQASLLDLNLGDPEIIAGEVLVNIESDA